MKYWIYQDNQVKGPFDRAQMGQLKGFNADTLVCPEGCKGVDMGDWQRAGAAPELAALLASAPVVAQAAGAAPARQVPAAAAYGASAEDSGLREAVSELKKRFSGLESAMERLEQQAKALGEEVARLQPLAQIAVQASQQEQSPEDKQARARIAELDSKLAALSKLEYEVRRLAERLDAAQTKPEEAWIAARPPAPAPGLAAPPALPEFPTVAVSPEKPAVAESAEFKVETFERQEPFPSLELPASVPVPLPAAEPAAQRPATGLTPPRPVPAPAASPVVEFSLPRTPPPAASAAISSSLPIGGMEGRKPAPAPRGPADLAAKSAQRKGGWSKKKTFAVFLPGVFAALVLAAYYFGGMEGGRSRPEAPQEGAAPPTPPAQQPSPQAPGAAGAPSQAGAPREELPPADLSQAAVDLVKNYVLPGGQGALGRRLDNAYPQNGGLSPWMVEPAGADRYQVNFYVGTRPLYVFMVQPSGKLVQAANDAALSLLNGEVPRPASPPVAVKQRRRGAAKGKKRTRKAKKSTAIMTISPSAAGGAQDSSNATIDELLGDEADSGAGKKK